MSKVDPVIAKLKRRKRADGLTQVQLGTALGIHQAHLSKVMSGKVPLSAKLKARSLLFLDGHALPEAPGDPLETELLQALRSSEAFKALLHAAMHLHKRKIE